MINKRVAGLLLAGLLAVMAVPATALAAGRHTARVEVPDQSRSTRQAALDDALAKVIQRVTGDRDAADRAKADSLLSRPGDFLQRFSYDRVDPDDSDAADASRLELVARFDGDSVRQALIEAGIPVWQRGVPPVLVWAGIEGRNGERFLVGSDEGAEWRQALIDSAAELGIELTFPLLDLEDQREVQFSDVAGGFTEPVRRASRRYEADLIVVGSLRADGSQWRGRWRLLGPAEWQGDWRDVQTSAGKALVSWRRKLASRLRERYTVLPDAESRESLPVRVTGVTSAQDVEWLQQQLEGSSGVKAVTLRRVKGDQVRFALRLSLDRERVVRSLDLVSGLERSEAQASEGESGVPAAGPLYRLDR